MTTAPVVVVDVPAGWRPSDIQPPKISESAGAELVQYAAFTSGDGAEAITMGCVATPIPGWVDDMKPAVEGRTVALAGASAALAARTPIDARRDGDAFALRSANDLEGPVVGRAKTFLGFDEQRVRTCFATCVHTPGHDGGGQPCKSAIDGARLEGTMPPPQAGLALRGVTWAVHHPGPFATGAGSAVILAGILAIALRRRPRTRMERPTRARAS